MFKKIFGALAVLICISASTVAAEHGREIETILRALQPHLQLPECERLKSNLTNNAEDIKRMVRETRQSENDHDIIARDISWWIENAASASRFWKPTTSPDSMAALCKDQNVRVYDSANQLNQEEDRPANALNIFRKEYPKFHWEAERK